MRDTVHALSNIGNLNAVTCESVFDRRVAIRRVGTAEYPHFPYDPPHRYPELSLFDTQQDHTNQVYDAVRNILIDLRLDFDHLGSRGWNPLGGFISAGQRALIKPNWVLHANRADGSIESLITHTSLIRAVIDYLLVALHHDGTIEIADAPLQNCDFDELVRRNLIAELIEHYRRQFPKVTFSILDLRKTIRTRKSRIPGIEKQYARSGDPRGYTMIDLKRDSFLAEIHHKFKRFRVTNYDYRMMLDHHNREKHEYLVSNSILSADFVVNLPKLKFHIKAGITAALKNLVGINGHKEFLPHHTNGCPATGGDQYPRKSHIKPFTNRVYDDYWTKVNESGSIGRLFEAVLIRGLKKAVTLLEGDRMYDGGWSGNDTIPRTTLDLNHALYYFDTSTRSLSDVPLRNVLHIVDGVVAGDGYGPLRPSTTYAGVILGGWNPLLVDLCGARLMGLDLMKVPLLNYGLTHPKSRFSRPCTSIGQIEVIDGGVPKGLMQVGSLGFRIPQEWQDAAI